MIDINFPYRFDSTGRTAVTGTGDHIRDMIEQVLFTAPGERVNRPDFGSGLLRLVFEPNSDALVAALRASVESSLQRWLGDLIQLEAVQVRASESQLEVLVHYIERRTQERRVERFRQAGGV